MGFRVKRFALAAVLFTGAACNSGRHSTAAFHLPPDGDVERGKAAFVAMGCQSCHEVSGVDLPKPTVQPVVPVVLGGMVGARLTDAYLTTSIINPSYDLAPGDKAQMTSGGQSRMPHYADKMTVRQLADIVAFLQSRYFVPRLPETYH